MKYLSKRKILLLHDQLLRAPGGSAGIRDEGLLESALHAPFQTFGGADLIETVLAIADGTCDEKNLLEWLHQHASVATK